MDRELPDAHFGDIADEELDDTLPETEGDDDDNDELLPETPKDVVELLGFDPLELNDADSA